MRHCSEKAVSEGYIALKPLVGCFRIGVSEAVAELVGAAFDLLEAAFDTEILEDSNSISKRPGKYNWRLRPISSRGVAPRSDSDP